MVYIMLLVALSPYDVCQYCNEWCNITFCLGKENLCDLKLIWW